jgi:hypothetical protein
MKTYWIKLLLFVVLFLAFDKLFIIVKNVSPEKEIDKRLEYIINGKINKDIIIAGSSRGSRDLIAGEMENQTGFTTYNLCYPGSNVEFHNFIIKTLAKFNNPPKIILLVVDDPSELIFDERIIFRKDRLYPLVKYPYIRDEMVAIGEKDKFLSKTLVSYQLNKYNFDLREKKFTPIDTILECGSMPISWQKGEQDWNNKKDTVTYDPVKELPEKVNAYKEIIMFCKSHDIIPVIIFPPNYQPANRSFVNRIKYLSGEGVYFYLYDTENPIYRDKSYYHDVAHLVRDGAEVFTKEVSNYINNQLNGEINLHDSDN